ncbi:hypothetical protein IWQ61_010061, partial [Dispira simplex]
MLNQRVSIIIFILSLLVLLPSTASVMKTNILAIVLLAMTALLTTTNASTHHPHRGIEGGPAELFFNALQNGDNVIDFGVLSDDLGIDLGTVQLMYRA